MKKVLLLALVAISTNFANAQDYKPFQLYLGCGINFTEDGGGAIYGIEPAYRLNDQISIGFKWELGHFVRVSRNEEISFTFASSYTLNSKYYFFSEGKFRLYAGAGIGAFKSSSFQFGNTGFGTGAGTKIVFYPRIGFDWGHFNFNIDYNFIPSSQAEGFDSTGDPATFDIANSYIGIRIGAFIFGGKY